MQKVKKHIELGTFEINYSTRMKESGNVLSEFHHHILPWKKLCSIQSFFLLVSLFWFLKLATIANHQDVENVELRNITQILVQQDNFEILPFDHLIKELLVNVTKAQDEMISKIRDDYGDYFDKIFHRDEVIPQKARVGRYRGFRSVSNSNGSETDVSLDRIKRKLQTKVLRVLLQPQLSNTESKMTHERFVWATGGHSASAGHGNLYNESYTAYMERDLQIVFGAVGIEFEGRNFAMGGTSSGLEVSMCWEQVFGSDVSIFSWDYGMTDGYNDVRLLHYAVRGGRTAGRPAFVALRTAGAPGRQDRLKELQNEMGMAVFVQDDGDVAKMRAAIPDSLGLSTSEIENLPKYVRNFKCGDRIEAGEPFCDQEKYSTDICFPRAHQKKWHPGL